ncbi:hypothetical protein [Adhaeribacter arboris]|uniref:hypothetical protein n=1 Tax=Adhaeribacter arboris TaxID=2072846 RepID=UPI00130484AF|nr:hypothetical protein [Adhaeribacter arboris]
MDVKIYSNSTEQKNINLAESLNLLAETLSNAQTKADLSKLTLSHKDTREAIQFLKSLL